MPKTKAKPQPKPRKSPAKRAKPQPPAAGLDARVVAAISLALHDEQIAAQRDEQLRSEASPWTILARARGVL
jgi:hypothetical protein